MTLTEDERPVEVPRALLERIVRYVDDHCDEGPYTTPWKSEQLMHDTKLITNILNGKVEVNDFERAD